MAIRGELSVLLVLEGYEAAREPHLRQTAQIVKEPCQHPPPDPLNSRNIPQAVLFLAHPLRTARFLRPYRLLPPIGLATLQHRPHTRQVIPVDPASHPIQQMADQLPNRLGRH